MLMLMLMSQEEEEERSKKEDDPRVNFRFAQIANEQDIQHMVSKNCENSSEGRVRWKYTGGRSIWEDLQAGGA